MTPGLCCLGVLNYYTHTACSTEGKKLYSFALVFPNIHFEGLLPRRTIILVAPFLISRIMFLEMGKTLSRL